MAAQFRITIGAQEQVTVQIRSRGGTPPPPFAATDTLTADVFRGPGQPPLFSPPVTWFTAANTQTGFDQGQATATLAATDTATLDVAGQYTLEFWWTQQHTCVARVTLIAVASAIAGAAVPTVRPYCSYQDLLDVAPWIRNLQAETDQEGWYPQRLEAREWMDEAIVNNYRGAFVGLFETHSTMAFEFGYAGWRRSLGPSPSLITYLAANQLILRRPLVRACAHHAAALIGLAQIGVNDSQASQGCYHRDMAERLAIGITAEVDLNADGVGELFINLGSTNTLFS